jgi:outer membrane protein
MKRGLAVLVVLTAATTALPIAQAREAGDWIVRGGIHNIDPKSDNSDIVDVDDAYGISLSGTYMFSPAWGVEILASLPFEHDIGLKDGTKVGETRHLPPTVSIQYHFPLSETIHPFVGAGVNYTLFFDEKTTGPLEGSKLTLDDSIGLAFQLGMDFDVGRNVTLNLDARYIDIETDAELDGAKIATVEIDPLAYGLTLGWRF